MEDALEARSNPAMALMKRTGEAALRLFDEAEEARLLFTADRMVVLVNQAAERMLDRSRAQMVGQPARMLAPERFADDYARVWDALISGEGRGRVHINLWGLRRDGTEFPVRISARVLTLSPGARLLSLVVTDRSDPSVGPSGRLRDFLDATHDGSVIIDATGRIVMANTRAEEIFQFEEAEMLGQPVEMLMPAELRGTHEDVRGRFTGRARSHEMAMGASVVARRKDGTTFPVRVVLSSLGTADEVLVSASVQDLSEIEYLQGESERLKEQFMATVSHELRTPLTSILGGLELLGDEVSAIEDVQLRSRLQRYVGMITRGARRQFDLVEDLLTLTEIDRSTIGERPGVVDLLVVVENAADEYWPKAEAVGLPLSTDLPDLPVLVRGDERWLGRALECLLSNAVKFTPAGGRIQMRVAGDGARAWVEVSDTGPGIAADEAGQVFDRLFRGQDAVVTAKQGAGLGLAIAHSIVQSMGGELRIIPQDRGARLRITLPLIGDPTRRGPTAPED